MVAAPVTVYDVSRQSPSDDVEDVVRHCVCGSMMTTYLAQQRSLIWGHCKHLVMIFLLSRLDRFGCRKHEP